MYLTRKTAGFSLLELMIATAIIVIIAAIALPAYNGYITTSRMSECTNEVALMQLAEEEFFLENNTYFLGGDVATIQTNSTGFYTSSYPNAAAIAAANCTYVVAVGTTGAIASSYNITATGANDLASEGVITTVGN